MLESWSSTASSAYGVDWGVKSTPLQSNKITGMGLYWLFSKTSASCLYALESGLKKHRSKPRLEHYPSTYYTGYPTP